MPFLSRKRKRKTAEEEDQNTSSSANTSINGSDVEMRRTDDSTNVSIDGSIRESLERSQTRDTDNRKHRKYGGDEEVSELEPVMEVMDEQSTQILSQQPMDEQTSNGWLDDMNTSLAEPTSTQMERNTIRHMAEAAERAKQNVSECGTIESITLHNFMCHSNFHLDFGPRINFIVGRNGSGKSAILTAIVLVLGGRASTTSRGKGIASFIKSGETQAKIILKICNSNENTIGKQGFNVEEFGKSIAIERTINSSGASTYKIKSSKGQVMGDRKDLLEDIVRYFNIQIDNPICALNQEVSRNFLNTKNSKDKYMFFMKATLLEEMKNDYMTSEADRGVSSDQLDKKKQLIPKLEKEVKDLQRKVRMFNELEDHKEKFVKLNHEYLWAIVVESERTVRSVRAQVDKYQKKVDSEMSKINAEKEIISEMKANKSELLERTQKLISMCEELKEKCNYFKDRCNELKEQIRSKEKDERNVKTELMETNRDMKSLELKIQELEQQFSDESHKNRKIEISKLKEVIERLKEDEQQMVNEYEELQQSMTLLSEETVRVKQELNQLSSSMEDKSRNIERLKQSRSERLQRFGPRYPELIRRIEEANNRNHFQHKPLGPFGNYIQLRDYSCAKAVETCLKRDLYAFCCDSSEDKQKLEKIIREVFGKERIPPIIIRKFRPLHDVSRYKARSDEFKSFFDLIVCKEPAITNCLIDKHKIEQIVYIPDYNRASDLLINQNDSIQNCYRVYSSDGSVHYPQTQTSDYKCYANNFGGNVNILMKNVDEALNQLNQEINDLKMRGREEKRVLDEKNKSIESKRQELLSFGTRIKSIRSETIRKDTELKQLESVGDSPPVEISTLEEELQSQATKKIKLEDVMQSFKNEREVIISAYTEADNEMRNKRMEYQKLLTEKDPLNEKREQINSDLEKHDLVVNEYERHLNETMALKTEEDNKLVAKEAEHESDRERALENTKEPVVTKRSSKTVMNEVNQLKKFLDESENRIGDKESIFKKYKLQVHHYNRVKGEVSTLLRHLNKLKRSLELRRRGYHELRQHYTIMTKTLFLGILRHKGFDGSLDIYHTATTVNGEAKKAQTLEIRVNPKSDIEGSQESVILTGCSGSYSDTRSLSGGERSYSTVAFIVALWEVAESPFKILDEVDVFMDLVTRKITMDAMIEFASQKSGKQYIFLSPLKLQNLPQPELIKIFQMPEPIRDE